MEEKLLEELGLSPSEARLYRTVAKAKQIAPAELAKAIDVKRTTAYSMARSLVEKGFLLEDITRRPRAFTLATPKELQTAIDAEKKRAEKRQMLLAKLAEEVSLTTAEETYPVPRIKFIEEERLNDFLRQAMPEWDKSMVQSGETTWWGFQDHTFIDFFLNSAAWYWKQAPKEIDLKLLTNRSPTEQKISGKFERRHVKFWGEATNFLSTTWVCGNYVIMLNTRNKPFYLVEIQNALMAHDQREVFKNLWPLV